MAPIWIGAIGAISLAALGLLLCLSWRPLGRSFGTLGLFLAALGQLALARNKRSGRPKWHRSGLVSLVPCSWRLLGFSRVALGGPWASVLASLGCSWRPWGQLGARGIYKEQGKSWTQMAPIWIGAIGAIPLAALGLLLCRSWRPLGPSFDILGLLLAALGPPRGHSVSTFVFLGSILAALGLPWGTRYQQGTNKVLHPNGTNLDWCHWCHTHGSSWASLASLLAAVGPEFCSPWVALGGPWATLGHAVSIRNKESRGPKMAPICIGAIGAILMAALGLLLCRSWRPLGPRVAFPGSLLAALGLPWGARYLQSTSEVVNPNGTNLYWCHWCNTPGGSRASLVSRLAALASQFWPPRVALGNPWAALGHSVSAKNKRSRGTKWHHWCHTACGSWARVLALGRSGALGISKQQANSWT